MFLGKQERYNLFDSVCVNFVYDYVLSYRWKERKKTDMIYRLSLLFLYEPDKEQMTIEIEDNTHSPSLKVLTKQKIYSD